MIFATLVSFIAGILWLLGLGLLLLRSINPSDLRGSHKDGSVIVFFSAFARAVFIKTRVDNSNLEILIARSCLVILIIFFISFSVAVVQVFEHHA